MSPVLAPQRRRPQAPHGVSVLPRPAASRFPAILAALRLSAAAVHAHPLGNDNIEHFSILTLLPDRLQVDLLLVVAETPAMVFQRDEIDANKDGEDTQAEQKEWLHARAREFAPFLKVTLGGEPLSLRAAEEIIDPRTGKQADASGVIVKLPGLAGMPTYRLLIPYSVKFESPLTAGEHVLTYEDATYPQHPGLKRIFLERSPKLEFTHRPPFWDEGGDPMDYSQYDPYNLPDERKASVTFTLAATGSRPADPAPADPSPPSAADSAPINVDQPASRPASAARVEAMNTPAPDAAASARRTDPKAGRLMDLLQGEWGLTVILTVTFLSFTWGAGHALMPGHAKTVVAAYLISQRGTWWHAVVLAIIVTVTHTALVIVVGVVWWAYQAIDPTVGPRLQLWLGVISGGLVAVMGLTLMWRAATGRLAGHHHDHTHDHAHDRRPWWKKLFTHSHPHLPGMAHHHHGAEHHHHHDHHHGHDHHHDDHHHTHDHGDAHDHHHDHGHHHHHDHGHSHTHDHPHAAGHGDHVLGYAAAPDNAEIGPELSFRTLLMLGIAGGIVPCPTATIIMLLGIGAGVVAGSLYAIGMFSLGLSMTLMLIGFLALSSRRIAARILSDARHDQEAPLAGMGRRLLLQVVPTLSGAAVVAIGLCIASNYIHTMWFGTPLFSWLG